MAILSINQGKKKAEISYDFGLLNIY